MIYKNVSGQAIQIGYRTIQPFEVFQVEEEIEISAVEKALKEGLVVEQITEITPSKENQING